MKERRVDIAVEDNYMFCGNCGNEIKEGEKFCSSCGTPVPAEEAIKETAKSAEQPADAAVAEPKKKKRKGGLIALILVLAVLVAGGGTAAVYFTSDGYKIGKNEKLANECVDAGDYKGALGYYKEILRLDDLREDIYLSAAEAYLELEKTDKALDMLQDGLKACKKDENAVAMLMAKQVEIYLSAAEAYFELEKTDKALDMLQDGLKACKKDENATAMLIGKQVEIYQKQIDDYLATGDYDKAFSLIDEAYAATNTAEILTRKTEVYKVESDAYANAGDFASARDILLRGIEETGDETLRAGITTAYLKEADAAIQEANYEAAESVLWEGISTTGDGDGNLLAKIADIYRLKSDAALGAGDCVYGVQLLVNGAEITGNTALIERADYVKQNVIALPERIWSGTGQDGIIYTLEYDDAGHLIKKTGKDILEDCIKSTVTYEYDDFGNVIKENDGWDTYTYSYEYDTDGNIVKEYWSQDDGMETRVREYNEAEKLIRSYMYSEDGENLEWEYTYEYDMAGNVVKECRYWPQEIRSDTIVYEYNEAGKLIRSYQFSEDNGEVNWEYNYEYGDNGYLIRQTSRRGESYSETEWDLNGNVTRKCEQAPWNMGYIEESTYEYEYDGLRCVKMCGGGIEGFHEYEFLYDEVGRLSGIREDGGYEYYDYTYNEEKQTFSVSNTDCGGVYQPLEGQMLYKYNMVSGRYENADVPSYSMYTYDIFGNKIYSVANFATYDKEDVVLSYVYRYTEE